jgi:hypothetical protein
MSRSSKKSTKSAPPEAPPEAEAPKDVKTPPPAETPAPETPAPETLPAETPAPETDPAPPEVTIESKPVTVEVKIDDEPEVTAPAVITSGTDDDIIVKPVLELQQSKAEKALADGKLVVICLDGITRIYEFANDAGKEAA